MIPVMEDTIIKKIKYIINLILSPNKSITSFVDDNIIFCTILKHLPRDQKTYVPIAGILVHTIPVDINKFKRMCIYNH